MPTYVYRREDGTRFEIQQRITEDPLTECPTTGQPVTRLITGSAGLIFKGDGFYLTDYARKDQKKAAGGGTSSSSTGDTAKADAASSEAPASSEGSSSNEANKKDAA